MKEIQLTQGRIALVDDDDVDRVSSLKWYYHSRVGYAITNSPRKHYARKKVWLHRFIMNAPEGMEVDHIDGNRLNNQRGNLRLCTVKQNRMNQLKQRRHTSSRFKGVSWHPGGRKWCASIRKDRATKYLGLFGNEEDAARAYDIAALQLFGAFAKLNFPEVAA